MFRSPLLWKLFGAYLVLILAAALAVGSAIQGRARSSALEHHREALLFTAELMRNVALPVLEAPVGSQLEVDLRERVAAASSYGPQRVTVMRPDGQVVADGAAEVEALDNHLQRPEMQGAIREGLGTSTRFSRTEGRRIFYVALPVRDGDELLGVVRAAISVSELEAELEELSRVVLWGALAAAGFGLIAALLFARRMSQNVDRMAETAESVAAGDYEAARPYADSRELGRLASALDAMAVKLRGRMQAVETDRAKLRAVLGSMVEGVVAIDVDDKVVHMNQVAGKFLGVAPGSSEGRRIWEAVRIAEVSELLDAAREVNGDVDGEIKLPADQSRGVPARTLELHASPLRNNDREVTGAVIVLHDVTDLRHLEDVRRDFVANVSHELKTPLTAIRALVETLLADSDTPVDTRQRFLEKVRVQGERLSALVADLLSLARVESSEGTLELHPMDLCEPLRDCAARFAAPCERKGITLELELPEGVLEAQADDEALRQILDNLADNAIKYTPANGRVVLALREQQGETGRRALLEVRDTGIGIEPLDRERVFERFYRVDKARSRELGGTGLGLAIVKHLVLSLGGRVSVESQPGQGSLFRVDLPAHQDAGIRAV